MFNQIRKTHTQKKASSRCGAVIHMEIPGDESCAEPGSSENSSSSVLGEHFSLAQSESVCQLWGIRSCLLSSEIACRDVVTFRSTRCQRQKARAPQGLRDPAAARIQFVTLCLRGLTLKTSICLSLCDFQVLHSHRKPSTENLH